MAGAASRTPASTPENIMKRNLVRIIVAVLLIAVFGFYLHWNHKRIEQGPVPQQITCINNLKQIGIAFRLWSGDHGDQFPFNVSTNAGGTLELCAADKDGFDSSAYVYLKTMTNELTKPLLLVCPRDQSRQPAATWESLQATNVTYRFHFGTNITERNPEAVLAVCPIDGNVLHADGSVTPGKADEKESEHSLQVR